MSAHNGKIGRLPEDIRDQLNQRLADGETARTVLTWLNALPAVQSVLAAQFAGQPVNEPNLSRWRTGGYQLWLRERERRATVRQLSADAEPSEVAELAAVLSQNFSTVIMADFALATRDVLRQVADPAERLHRIRAILRTVTQQRRVEYLTGRLQLDQERRAQTRLQNLANSAHTPPTPSAPDAAQAAELR